MTDIDPVQRACTYLAEIPALWAEMDPDLVSGTPDDSEGGRTAHSASRVLINAEVVDMSRGYDLWCWCMLVIDEQAHLEILDEQRAPASTAPIQVLCDWLTDQASWIIANHEFFLEDLTRIYWKYRNLAGKPAPTTFKCPDCGNRIRRRAKGAWWQCTACGRLWTLDAEVQRLATADANRMTLTQIAKTTGIPDRTLRYWAQQGRITPVGTRHGRKLYDLDHIEQARERTKETV